MCVLLFLEGPYYLLYYRILDGLQKAKSTASRLTVPL
jgi:hypothetical protein